LASKAHGEKVDMKWPTMLRGRADASLGVRLFVHAARLAVLVVGFLVISEAVFTYACLEHVEYAEILRHIADCAGVTVFFLIWLGLPYLAIRLTPVVILALAGTLFWAWLDRRQSK
jgi:hypothetical protein